MPKLTESQQEMRRTRILDAAEICFARTGFHRTTMQDICREAGVSAGAVYIYFDSKEALIEGISTRSREEVLEAFEKLRQPQDFALALGQVMQECILSRPAYKSILWLEISAEATRNSAISATHHNCEQHVSEELVTLLEGASREGRIAPVLPIPDIVAAMMVIADGLFLRRAVDPQFDAAATGQTILTMLAGLIHPVMAQPAVATSNDRTAAEAV